MKSQAQLIQKWDAIRHAIIAEQVAIAASNRDKMFKELAGNYNAAKEEARLEKEARGSKADQALSKTVLLAFEQIAQPMSGQTRGFVFSSSGLADFEAKRQVIAGEFLKNDLLKEDEFTIKREECETEEGKKFFGTFLDLHIPDGRYTKKELTDKKQRIAEYTRSFGLQPIKERGNCLKAAKILETYEGLIAVPPPVSTFIQS